LQILENFRTVSQSDWFYKTEERKIVENLLHKNVAGTYLIRISQSEIVWRYILTYSKEDGTVAHRKIATNTVNGIAIYSCLEYENMPLVALVECLVESHNLLTPPKQDDNSAPSYYQDK